MNNHRRVPERPRFLRFPTREQILFAKRIAMMLRAGVPLFEAVEMLRAQAQSASARYVWAGLAASLERGSTFAAAMAELNLFNPVIVSMVRVGESSGLLYENLLYCAEELRRAHQLKRKVLGALIYPAVVSVATIGMALSITLYIFPKIAPIFHSFKHSLPLSTRMVIALSQFLLHNGWYVLALVIIVGATAVYARRLERVRSAYEIIVLHTPIFGILARTYHLATIARTLGMLLAGATPVVIALEITAGSITNTRYRRVLLSAMQELERGATLTEALGAYASLFPSLFIHMIAAGERAGDLSGALLYVAELYEADLAEQTSRMTELLEPVLMIAMGIIVGFLAISIITPIYGITQDLSGYR